MSHSINTEELERTTEELERNLKKGMLILKALKAGISPIEIASRAQVSEEEVTAIQDEARKAYAEMVSKSARYVDTQS